MVTVTDYLVQGLVLWNIRDWKSQAENSVEGKRRNSGGYLWCPPKATRDEDDRESSATGLTLSGPYNSYSKRDSLYLPINLDALFLRLTYRERLTGSIHDVVRYVEETSSRSHSIFHQFRYWDLFWESPIYWAFTNRWCSDYSNGSKQSQLPRTENKKGVPQF